MKNDLVKLMMEISSCIIKMSNILIKNGNDIINDDIIQDECIQNKEIKFENENEIKVEFKRTIDLEKQKNYKPKEVIKLQKGSICKRSDGRYMGRFRHDGKELCVYSRSYNDCAKKLRDKMKSVMMGVDAMSTSKGAMTVGAWVKYWIEYFVKPRVKDTTLLNYSNDVKLLLQYDKFCSIKLNKLNRINVIELMSNIESTGTKRRLLERFKNAYECAYNEGYVNNNFLKNVSIKLEQRNKQDTRALNKHEIDALKNRIMGLKCEYPILWLLNSGMRKGEMLALRWDDIDEINNTISISKSYDERFKKISTPKTKSSIRTIPLFINLKKLIPFIKKLPSQKNDGYVFSYIWSNQIATRYNQMTKELGLPTREHNLRHTFASNCYELGIDPMIVKEWLGHTDVKTTLGVYTQISSDAIQMAVNKMNE